MVEMENVKKHVKISQIECEGDMLLQYNNNKILYSII